MLLTEPHAWAGSTGFIMRWDDRIGSWVVRIDNLGQQVAAFDNWKAV